MLKIDQFIEENISLFLQEFLKKKFKPIIQNENEAICVGPRNENDCRINWNEWDCNLFPRYLKALVPPYPRPFFFFKNLKCEIIECKIRKINYIEINGHVVHVSKDMVGIKIKDGVVYFQFLLINEKQIKASEILTKIGIRLK